MKRGYLKKDIMLLTQWMMTKQGMYEFCVKCVGLTKWIVYSYLVDMPELVKTVLEKYSILANHVTPVTEL